MRIDSQKIDAFKKTVWGFYRAHGRAFPWRTDISPYRVFVSELMLQQTQTARVEAKFIAFLQRFPHWEALAAASLTEVYQYWAGLGYNRRARALRDSAQIIIRDFGGQLPFETEYLESLPGVGRYTAMAIRAFAFNKSAIVVETNIRAAVIHSLFKRRRSVDDSEIERVLEHINTRRVREWYWALMDYGAWIKKESRSITKRSAQYRTQSRFEGSVRQARGRILEAASEVGQLPLRGLATRLGMEMERIEKALHGLIRDNMITISRGRITLCH